MDVIPSYQQFVALLRQAVCGGAPPDRPLAWQEILKLAKRNKVESIIYYALKDAVDVPGEVYGALQTAWNRGIVQDTRQLQVSQRIREAFSEEGIPFAPMKGLVLKGDYPFSNMRFMSDLDYYIRAEDRGRIHACMMRLGAQEAEEDSGDVNYDMPGHVHVEFHGRLLYRTSSGGVLGYSDWNRVDESQYSLTEDGYAMNLIGHIGYNLAQAGCGVRFILDLWVYRHLHQPQPDWNAVMEQMKDDGLNQVAENLIALSEYWFGGGQWAPILDELGTYILDGGLYGSRERETLSKAGFGGGKLGAVKSQIFRHREEFENRYPWLKSYPFLLPVAWVMRGMHSLKIHRGQIKKWVKQLNQNSQREILEQRARLRRFGFD